MTIHTFGEYPGFRKVRTNPGIAGRAESAKSPN